jgi:RNA polymerase sigma factor (sigma-70 family)
MTGPVLGTQSDERLTELARGGSDAAFEAIVVRYRRPLLRHCARVVGDTDAEEAVQDALLRAHGALSRGDAVRDVKSWLHVVAHNAALNILRARRSRPESAHSAVDPADCEDLSALQREALRDVLAAVSALPARQRDAIVMRELEGRSYDEIAGRLGTSNGAVRQLLNRARNAVRDRLGALTVFEPLARWVAACADRGTVARVGALSGGCALTAKLCTAALLPAVLTGHGAVREHTIRTTAARSTPAHTGSAAPATAPGARHVLAGGAPAARHRDAVAVASRRPSAPKPGALTSATPASVRPPTGHDRGTSRAPSVAPDRLRFTGEQPGPPGPPGAAATTLAPHAETPGLTLPSQPRFDESTRAPQAPQH